MIIDPILAYVGPGMGLGTAAAILAGIGAFFAIVLGFVYYPVKKLIMKIKDRKNK